MLLEEGELQTEIMKSVKNTSGAIENQKHALSLDISGNDSELAQAEEEQETEALATTILDMLLEHEGKKANSHATVKTHDNNFKMLEMDILEDLKNATSCAASASRKYQG